MSVSSRESGGARASVSSARIGAGSSPSPHPTTSTATAIKSIAPAVAIQSRRRRDLDLCIVLAIYGVREANYRGSIAAHPLLEPAHPGCDRLGELGPGERDEVVVAEAGEDMHVLRLRRGLEQGPALRQRDDVVAVPVENQEGR